MLYSFIITDTENGRVLDFGTYYDKQCAIDTAKDSPAYRVSGVLLTVTEHDDDGSHTNQWENP